jgi:hypothetical protein
MQSSSFSYRLSVFGLTALVGASVLACGEQVPLYSFPRAMCGATAIQGAPDASHTDAPSTTLAVSDGARLFWLEDDYNFRNSAEGVIHAGSLSGGNDVVLATDTLLPTQLAVDEEQVYWGGASTGGEGTAIKAVDKRGGTPRVIATIESAWDDRFGRIICQGGVVCPYRFAVDATDVYYGANNTLRRVDKRRPQSAPVELTTGRITSIAVDEAAVYWIECSDDVTKAILKKLAKSGGTPTQLAEFDAGYNCTAMSNRLALDETTAYLAVALSVYAVSKDGSSTITFDTGGRPVTSLSVSASDVYWVTSGSINGGAFGDDGSHSLVRAPKQGGAFVELVPLRVDQPGANDSSCDPLDLTVNEENLYWVVSRGVLTKPMQSVR